MSGMLLHRELRFPSGCSVRSVIIRETTGHDEVKAALAADAQGERTSIYQELVKQAIVAVDGERVVQPYVELMGWNSKTRELVKEAFDKLNETKEEEKAVFFATARDVDPKTLEPVQNEEEEPETLAAIGQ